MKTNKTKEMMMNKQRERREIRRSLADLYRASPAYVFVSFLAGLSNAASPVLVLWFSGRIISKLAAAATLADLSFEIAAVLAASFLIPLFTNVLDQWLLVKNWLLDADALRRLTGKTARMDYSAVEDPETAALREQLKYVQRTNVGGTYTALGHRLPQITKAFFSGLFGLILILPFFSAGITDARYAWLDSPWLIVLIPAVIAATTALSYRMSRRALQLLFADKEGEAQIVKMNQRYNYMSELVFTREFGGPFRVQRLQPNVSATFDSMLKHVRKHYLPAFSAIGMSSIPFLVLTELVFVGLTGLAGLKAVYGLLPVGLILPVTGGLRQLMTALSELVTQISRFLGDKESRALFYRYMDMPETMRIGSVPVEKRLDNEYEFVFQNVSFAYPGSERLALDDVSLRLEVGKKLAVVGLNGSGKTTLVKLLCRLYRPDAGAILLNGIDIWKYDHDEYMKLLSVVFQDFSLFEFTVGENVASASDYDRGFAASCLSSLGFTETNERRDGEPDDRPAPPLIDTYIGKRWDPSGIDFSGGERQKIAMARAVYKQSPVLVLDEPTAALDPLSEFEIYARIRELTADKSAIFISHRLASCRFCDEIAVFNDGRVVELGDHETLLADGGLYAKLWEAQAENYRERPVDPGTGDYQPCRI